MENRDFRNPPSLLDLGLAELAELLRGWGEPAYRAMQVWEWLYKRLVQDSEEMTNLPKALRSRLASQTTVAVPRLLDTTQTGDGRTRKDLLALQDGESIETVLMRYHRRRTVCVSTQVGCPMACAFCATGQMGFRRNLSVGEIVAQVLHFQRYVRRSGQRLTNVVFMGMGEPLLNYGASIAAVRRCSHPRGLNIGQRHITISTVGLAPEIKQLATEGLRIRLAVSLHAATDDLRSQLIPANKRYSLDVLLEACRYYVQHTGRRVTFEWALIRGVNDSREQAQALVARLNAIPSHVNIIPANPTGSSDFQAAGRQQVSSFAAILDAHGIPNTVRLRRGVEIEAGCGQLRQRPHSSSTGVLCAHGPEEEEATGHTADTPVGGM